MRFLAILQFRSLHSGGAEGTDERTGCIAAERTMLIKSFPARLIASLLANETMLYLTADAAEIRPETMKGLCDFSSYPSK